MSVEAFAWALSVPIGGNQKIMLLGLANHAHPDGTESYPGLDTLAKYGFCDRSTARRNVRKLEELGWIREDGVGPQGQTKYRLRMADDPWPEGGGETPPLQNATGGKSGSGGVAAVPPEPTEPSRGGEETRASASQRPEGFPDELVPHARAVFPILKAVAEQHNAKAVLPLALGRMMMGRPRKPFVRAAHDFASWATDPGRPIRDVVASYRTWLDRTPDLAGPERLDDAGVPTASPPPSSSRRRTVSDPESDATRARREAAFDRLSGNGGDA